MFIPSGFLPFGPIYGDSAVPRQDDGSSEEIQLRVDVVIFGSRQSSLYVSQNYSLFCDDIVSTCVTEQYR